MIIMEKEEEEEEEQIFFWRRDSWLLEVIVSFLLSFLNWGTCTCMEEGGF